MSNTQELIVFTACCIGVFLFAVGIATCIIKYEDYIKSKQ